MTRVFLVILMIVAGLVSLGASGEGTWFTAVASAVVSAILYRVQRRLSTGNTVDSDPSHSAVAPELIERDADVNAKDHNDQTPLHVAAEHDAREAAAHRARRRRQPPRTATVGHRCTWRRSTTPGKLRPSLAEMCESLAAHLQEQIR